ncbi:MAG: glucose-6-phosphate isomerase, partial [Myxococcales bacterium]|nr:glucose-6-phosphate isomerase [Myxococcales bacterium]
MDTLFLAHPTDDLAVDLTRTGIDPSALDALPWEDVFAAMRDLEAGSVANPDEGRQVGHYWLRAPDHAPTVELGEAIGSTRDAVMAFAEGVRSGATRTPDGSPFTDVLHVGIGGSALGPQLLVDALGTGPLRLSFVDNIDPDGIQRTLDALGDRLDTTLVVGVSKSGGTPETAHGITLVRRALEKRGLHAPGHMVAVTGEGSQLDVQAREEAWLARFAMWDWVGGRTSVTSAVGLLPGALA